MRQEAVETTFLMTQHSEELNEHASPLLRLPGELRNHVYSYVFEGSVLHFVTRSPTRARFLDIKLQQSAPLEVSLSSVCRKLRRGAVLLPFNLSAVSCQALGICEKLALLLTKPQLRAITSFRITVYQHHLGPDKAKGLCALGGVSPCEKGVCLQQFILHGALYLLAVAPEHGTKGQYEAKRGASECVASRWKERRA
jgi:hypothetical protein